MLKVLINCGLKNKTDLYYKTTHTSQYSDSNVPWNYKVSWVKCLYPRAENFCSWSEKFKFQINKIKMFMSWNDYPSFSHNAIIKQLKTSPKNG